MKGIDKNMKPKSIDDIFLMYGDLALECTNYKNEIIHLKNSNAEYNEKALYKQIKSSDIYKEIENNGIIGTTLINLLNKSNNLLDILNHSLNELNTWNPATLVFAEKDITIFDVLTIFISNLKSEVTNTVPYLPLQALLTKQFFNFTKDFGTLSSKFSTYTLLDTYKTNSSKTKYHKLMYDYLLNIQDRSIGSKDRWFEKISETEIVKIFIQSLIEDIHFIQENCELDVENFSQKAKLDKCHIKTLIDLFYWSKYHIHIAKKKLKICKQCGKYFITKSKCSEVYCRRKYKNQKYTCNEYNNKGYRQTTSDTRDLKKDISNKKNTINTMLNKRDKKNGTNQKRSFNLNLNTILKKINSLNVSEDEKLKLQLEWLCSEHLKLKNKSIS